MIIFAIKHVSRGRYQVARILLKLFAELTVEMRDTLVVSPKTVVRVWWVQLGPIAFGYGRGGRWRHSC